MRIFVLLVPVLALVSVMNGCGSTAEAPVYAPGEQQAMPRTRPGPARAAQRPSYYVVTRGDTLYSIAWRYSFDYRKLAAWNHISSPYTIFPGQRIYLHDTAPAAVTPPRSIGKRDGTSNVVQAPKTTPGQGGVGVSIHWRWPTRGRLITSSSPTLQKGVNISGRTGQAIYAAAAGDVVYSGSGLLGYGKLIIIKHNDVYLSAYAYNQEILVKEGMRVSSGQKIATMGTDSDRRPLLHFEIRKEGQPVNPLRHLPKQQS